ncbi:transglycosylase SLT domain-containing protein, partial [Kitasatospora cinereorecta]
PTAPAAAPQTQAAQPQAQQPQTPQSEAAAASAPAQQPEAPKHESAKPAAPKAEAPKPAAKAAETPAAKAQPEPQQQTGAASRSEQRSALAAPADSSPAAVQELARSIVPAGQYAAFSNIVSHESGWDIKATNASSGAYGLAQALPGSKMASVGADWRTNPEVQIKWALNYMNERYGSPNAAWAFWQTHHWY